MILSHKIRILTNNIQANHLQQCCGVARFAYNWALDRWNTYCKFGLKVNVNQLDKDYNKLKKLLFPWAYDVSKNTGQNAIMKNLKSSFDGFFKKTSKYPRFKRKGIRDSFTVNNTDFKLDGKYVRLPKIGTVKLSEPLRFEGKIMSATISKDVDKWFISITVDLGEEYSPIVGTGTVGIDLGIKTAVVTSDGRFMDSPKPLRRLSKHLTKLQKDLSRKKKGSNNRNKARIKVARMHRRIRYIRSDWIHKTTSKIASENQVVFMEDLAVSNMMKNHKLAKAISDMGWYEIYRQLNYKTQVVKIDRFFPSSKTCNKCGEIKKDLKLSNRIFNCDCGYTCDRDVNAAKNIYTRGLREIEACGDGSYGRQVVSDGETTIREAGTNHQTLVGLGKN